MHGEVGAERRAGDADVAAHDIAASLEQRHGGLDVLLQDGEVTRRVELSTGIAVSAQIEGEHDEPCLLQLLVDGIPVGVRTREHVHEHDCQARAGANAS